MPKPHFIPVLLALLLACVLWASFAVAQEGNVETDTAAPVLTPPKLEKYVQAEYPPEALELGLQAAVHTRIDIDAEGKVTGVEVLETVGHGFDEAAVLAIKKFIFSPATRDGVPIGSQVRYRYTFFFQEPESEADEVETLPGKLEGRVTDLEDKPLGESWISLRAFTDANAEGEELDADSTRFETNSRGEFTIENLEGGSYIVEIYAPGYMVLELEEIVDAGETKSIVYRLEPEKLRYETVVRARALPREVTRREITRREITRIPGTGGDALRSIQNLPGMARAPAISGALIVRGSSPGDSKFFFDSIPVPLLYHFGGLTSVINSDLLESIDFFPGNYSLKYGGATGGIVDVYPRQPATDRIHASLDADFWDASLLFEMPLGEDWSIALSGRRSYIDAILNATLPSNGGFEFVVAPRYYDYQVITDYHPNKNNNLRIFLFGSDDKLVLVFGDSVAGNPNFVGGVDFRVLFHQIQARWDLRLSKNFSNQVNVAFGYQQNDSSFGVDIKFDQQRMPFHLRDEFTLTAHKNFILRTGIDFTVDRLTWEVRAPANIGGEGEQFDPLGTNTEFLETAGTEWIYRPGLYTEAEITVIPKLRLIGGLRVDHYNLIHETSLDPRLTARYQLFEKTTLKGGVGVFHQSPNEAQTDVAFGNPDLGLIKSIHYGLGVEQKITENIEIGLEGFYKDIDSLVVSSDNMIPSGGDLVPERFNNEGQGKVYGLEFLAKHQPTDRFFGWISYTLMKSKRIDHPGESERLFDFDQTHILTVVASAVLGRGWEAGFRFRLVSGNPVTPITNSVYDGDSDIYFPVYGPVNSERLPLFHQLDIRVDKNWQFKYWKFAVYLDVQNIYNHANVEGYQYNYDYSIKQYFQGLPVIPSLGLKAEY